MSDTQEKTFSQDELNEILKDYVHKDKVTEIVKKRLARANDKKESSAAQADKDQAKDYDLKLEELNKKAYQLDCKEYLMEKGYSKDLIDIIDAKDIDDFKTKAEKIVNFSNKQHKKTSPEFRTHENTDDLRAAFFSTSREPKHKY